jgi:hypothetical protein
MVKVAPPKEKQRNFLARPNWISINTSSAFVPLAAAWPWATSVPNLYTRDNSTYLADLSKDGTMKYVKHWTRFLAHSKDSINGCYYYCKTSIRIQLWDAVSLVNMYTPLLHSGCITNMNNEWIISAIKTRSPMNIICFPIDLFLHTLCQSHPFQEISPFKYHSTLSVL